MTPVLGTPKDRAVTPCTSCQASMTYIETHTGSKVPLSMASAELRWVEIEPGVWAMRWAYLSHFADCPFANQHRRQARRPTPPPDGPSAIIDPTAAQHRKRAP